MQRRKEIGLVASVLLWLRSNELVSTSFVDVPPCFFVGTFKEKTSKQHTL
jgi:hypothetical protein